MTARRVALVGLASVALLAGCASTPPIQTLAPAPVHTFTPAPVIATPPPVVAPARVSDDAGYLSNERRVYDFTGVTDAKLLDVGYTVCDTLDAGVTVPKLHTILTNTAGADPKMGNAVLAGAIVFLCPEYQAALSAYTGKS